MLPFGNVGRKHRVGLSSLLPTLLLLPCTATAGARDALCQGPVQLQLLHLPGGSVSAGLLRW